MDSNAIVALSRRVASSFVRKMPGASHLFEELAQEAAIAIMVAAERYRPGPVALTSYVWPRAWKVMQMHCAHLGGPVTRPSNEDGYHPTCSIAVGDGFNSNLPSPEEHQERAEADATFRALCEQAATKFKNPTMVVAVLHAAFSGDSYDVVAKAHGLSRQRVHQIVAKSGLADLVSP